MGEFSKNYISVNGDPIALIFGGDIKGAKIYKDPKNDPDPFRI